MFFITFLIVGLYFFFSALVHQTNYDLFSSLMMYSIGSFIVTGVVGAILFAAGVLEFNARRHRTRLRRRARRWRRSYFAPHEHEEQGSMDEITEWPEDAHRNIPDWLIPLLRNRSTAVAIHKDIVSSTETPEEAESQFQTRLDDLETELITIFQTRHSEQKITEASGLITEAEIEKEAVLDLLGALELQHQEGKVSKAFYERKRDQLLERLAKAV